MIEELDSKGGATNVQIFNKLTEVIRALNAMESRTMIMNNGEILDFLAELSEACQSTDGEPIDVLRRVRKLVEEKFTPTNSAMDAIAALANKWCDITNQPDNICVALYQFTKWARQQHPFVERWRTVAD